MPNFSALAQRILNSEDPTSKQFLARAGRCASRARPPTPMGTRSLRGSSCEVGCARRLWPGWAVALANHFCRLPVSSVLHAPHAPLDVGTAIVVVPADRFVTPENLAAIGPAVCAPQGCKGYRTTHTHTDYLAEIFFPPPYQREVMPINGISFTFTC